MKKLSKTKNLDLEINQFIDEWDSDNLTALLTACLPLVELYYVDEDQDWVKDAVGDEETRTIRIIRTAYLISKLADMHAGKLSLMKAKYKDLWRRMEQTKVDVGVIL